MLKTAEEKIAFKAIFGFECKDNADPVEQAMNGKKVFERLSFLASGWKAAIEEHSLKNLVFTTHIELVLEEKTLQKIVAERYELLKLKKEIEFLFPEAVELAERTFVEIKTKEVSIFSLKYPPLKQKDISVYKAEMNLIYLRLNS